MASTPEFSPESHDAPRQRRRRRRLFSAPSAQADGAARQSAAVGQQLRKWRKQRRLSIRSLAELSKLNVNTLSMIENEKTSPSVATLQQLAIALQIPITAFFEEGTPQNKIAFHKANQGSKTAFAHGTLEDLGKGLISRGAEPFLLTLEPRAGSGDQPIVHTGREFVFCLAGQLTYIVEDQQFLLEPGDSLLFEAHLPHCWHNAGDTPARSLLVLCPADENDRPTDQHFKGSR